MNVDVPRSPGRIVVPRARSPRVSILVVTARQPELLGRCLESIARCGSTVPFETVIVLNDALPEVTALVRERVDGVEVVASSAPLGLAGGLNRARAAAAGELLVSFHDDAEAEPGWLDALVAAADAHPEAGVVGSTILDLDGGPQSMGSVLWRDGRVWTLGRGAAALVPASETISAVDYCGTSSVLVRAATWDAIGGADERFHSLFYVDVDLCFATWRRGEAVLCTPASRARHHRSASTEPRFREFLLQRNRGLFVEKWDEELAILEPPAPGSEAGVRRAVERAQERWRRSGGAGEASRRAAAPAGRAFDAVAQERRALGRALELERAWARAGHDELRRVLAERDAALAERDAALAAAEEARDLAEAAARAREEESATLAALRARDATLAAIERGRWWRLYRRLLPLLQVARRISRRGGASRTG